MKTLVLTAVVLAAALVGAAPLVGAAGDAAAGPLFGEEMENGTLAIGRSHDRPVLSTDALAPGHPARGSIRVWNDGTIPAVLTLYAEVDGDPRLLDALRLRITTKAGALLYDGPVSAFAQAGLGTFDPGDGATVLFRAGLPAEQAAGLDGLSLSADFRWSATQA
jgi:hypothetical protein